MWIIFEVFIEFVTILLLFYVLVPWPRGTRGLSSPPRIEPAPAPTALEGEVLTTGLPGKSQKPITFKCSYQNTETNL